MRWSGLLPGSCGVVPTSHPVGVFRVTRVGYLGVVMVVAARIVCQGLAC